MAVKDWKTTPIPYEDITDTRHATGCEWCLGAFGRAYPATLVGRTDDVVVVHDHCLEPMRRRHRLGEIVDILRPLAAAYESADDALTDHPEYENGTVPDGLYHRRDDAAVEVAGWVSEMLGLIELHS